MSMRASPRIFCRVVHASGLEGELRPERARRQLLRIAQWNPIMFTGEVQKTLADPHEDSVSKDPGAAILEEPHSVADTT
jgi:hypothetical protein